MSRVRENIDMKLSYFKQAVSLTQSLETGQCHFYTLVFLQLKQTRFDMFIRRGVGLQILLPLDVARIAVSSPVSTLYTMLS